MHKGAELDGRMSGLGQRDDWALPQNSNDPKAQPLTMCRMLPTRVSLPLSRRRKPSWRREGQRLAQDHTTGSFQGQGSSPGPTASCIQLSHLQNANQPLWACFAPGEK